MTALLDGRGPATGAPAPPPRRAPGAFRTELRRGFAPWAGAALFLTLAWALVAKSDGWQGSWAQTTETLRLSGVMLGGPLALGAGCWQGGRERRRGTADLRATSARAPLARFGTAALPLVLWLMAGYALAVGGALLATWPYALQDSPSPTAPLGAAGVVTACALLGHVVGATVPWRLAAPVLAVAGYGVFGVLITKLSSSAVRHLGPVPSYAVGRELLAWWAPLLTAGWFLALACTAVLAHAARRRWTALGPLAVALAAALTLVHSGADMVRPDPRRHHQVCTTSTTPQICVNATRAALLPEVTRALTPLLAKLKGVRNLPTRFEDLPGRPGADEAKLPMVDLGWRVVRGRITDPAQFAWEAQMALHGYDCPVESVRPTAAMTRADRAVERWLTPRGYDVESDRQLLDEARRRGDTERVAELKAENAAYTRLASMRPAERRDWLSRYYAATQSCERDPGEVPAL
ncbi:hypothetical protein [Streptomyces sp. VRA16 Mangrove soil]|uniref:hypothetical protein n=1 Tax=Streptomyces sp. VRA16 Mangrove soil TaxID=2817434 RepID=UPI001A9D1759|nr:hypothetical protein [Streptomyces sp. VRA16 Mangrove soil]MBO1334031.1 hypothetical protein [Streptomyces sp. VRA16 Mangrove soil]